MAAPPGERFCRTSLSVEQYEALFQQWESGVGLDRCDSLRAWAGSDGSYSVTLGFQGPYYWVLKGSRALTIRSFEALGYGWCPWRVASRLNVN